jgi:amidase
MNETELAFAGIVGQAELIRDGEVSPRELVEVLLRRIERIDPKLNAFRVVLAERALEEAEDAERARGQAGAAQPLLGVPVAIKDDTDVAGEVTAHGSSAYGPAATADAEVVRRLRAAGAIVLGKTNVPELEIFPFTESEAWGATRNPWDLSRTPGGSSGGSAAAVAAGLVGAALGSDGGGSIRIPAACCGIFGLKTQRGRIPWSKAEGWHGLSVYGPLARRVRDAALFLEIASGESGFVAAAARDPGKLRIAVSTKVPPGVIAPVAPEIRTAVRDAEALIESLGHAVVHEDPRYGLATLGFTARFFRGIHDEAESMANPARLEPRTRGMARIGKLFSPRLLARARAQESRDADRINAIFDRHDVVLTPALATLPPRVGKWEGRGALWTFNGIARYVPFNAVWNHLGNPGATVPVGATMEGVPLCVQLLGRPGDEATLLSLAAQIEAARPWAGRRPQVAVAEGALA